MTSSAWSRTVTRGGSELAVYGCHGHAEWQNWREYIPWTSTS